MPTTKTGASVIDANHAGQVLRLHGHREELEHAGDEAFAAIAAVAADEAQAANPDDRPALQPTGQQQQSEAGEVQTLTAENARLTKQIGRLKQEYDAKIDRLNTRIRELSGSAGAVPVGADSSRKGFFRR